jgi:hypothetical protein
MLPLKARAYVPAKDERADYVVLVDAFIDRLFYALGETVSLCPLDAKYLLLNGTLAVK